MERRRQQPKRKRRWVTILVAIVLVLLGGLAWATFGPGAKPFNVLLMGLDEGKTRTDVVVLAHVDPRKRLVNLISMPRDTLVEIPCQGNRYCVTPDKLTHAHVYGGEDGPQMTVKAVEGLLGVKIDHYVRVDFDGFQKVVDVLGGVDMVIDKDMNYEDPVAHPPLRIHFKASPVPQHLDGKQALEFVRYRGDGLGDVGRTERTKQFLVALGKQAKDRHNLLKLPGVVTKMLPYVKTDLTPASALKLARAAWLVDMSKTQMATLPGHDDPNNRRGWVWIADKVKTQELVRSLILDPKAPAAAKSEPTQTTPTPTPAPAPKPQPTPAPEPVQPTPTEPPKTEITIPSAGGQTTTPTDPTKPGAGGQTTPPTDPTKPGTGGQTTPTDPTQPPKTNG